MVSLEDIPEIPAGQEALMVEVAGLSEKDRLSSCEEINNRVSREMYYLTQSSRRDIGRGILILLKGVDDKEFYGRVPFKLENIRTIQPLTYRE